IISIDEREAAGAELLVKVARDHQRKFRGQGQEPSEAVGAETIRVRAGAGGRAEGKIMLALGQRVDEQGAPPEKMRRGLHMTVAVETVVTGVQPELALVPGGQFEGHVG